MDIFDSYTYIPHGGPPEWHLPSVSCLLSPFLQPLSLRLNLLFFLSSLFLFFLLPVPGARLVFLAWPTQLKTLLLRPLVRLVSVITCRYCVILQRKPTNLPAPSRYGTLLAYHDFSVDVPVCPGGPALALSGGQALAAPTARTAVPSRKLEAMHPTYAVQLFAIPCNGLRAHLPCPSRCQCSLYLGIICLPGQDEPRVATRGKGLACSIAGRTRFDVTVAPGHCN